MNRKKKLFVVGLAAASLALALLAADVSLAPRFRIVSLEVTTEGIPAGEVGLLRIARPPQGCPEIVSLGDTRLRLSLHCGTVEHGEEVLAEWLGKFRLLRELAGPRASARVVMSVESFGSRSRDASIGERFLHVDHEKDSRETRYPIVIPEWPPS